MGGGLFSNRAYFRENTVYIYIYIYICTIYIGLSQARPNNIYYAWITVTSFAVIVYTHACTIVFKKLNYGKKRK